VIFLDARRFLLAMEVFAELFPEAEPLRAPFLATCFDNDALRRDGGPTGFIDAAFLLARGGFDLATKPTRAACWAFFCRRVPFVLHPKASSSLPAAARLA
jgi:hypothetical protein